MGVQIKIKGGPYQPTARPVVILLEVAQAAATSVIILAPCPRAHAPLALAVQARSDSMYRAPSKHRTNYRKPAPETRIKSSNDVPLIFCIEGSPQKVNG